MVRIDLARPGDAEGIVRVHEQAWKTNLVPLLPPQCSCVQMLAMRRAEIQAQLQGLDRTQQVLVARHEENVVGFTWYTKAAFGVPGFQAELNGLYVAPAAQRTGIGSLLMTAALREMRRARLARVALWVLEQNTPARRFYGRLGGSPLALRKPLFMLGFSYASHALVAYGWEDLDDLTT